MKKTFFSLLLCLAFLTGILSKDTFAVTGDQVAADGTYTAQGEVKDDNFWDDEYTFELSLTVSDGTISAISQRFTSTPYEADSEEEYHPRALNVLTGKLRGKPASVSAVDEYAADAVSRATFSYNALKSAVRDALKSAPEAAGGVPVTKYAVSYDLGGAPGEAPETELYAPGETVAVEFEPVWDGHIFDGWSGASVVSGIFTMPEKAVTLTARWISKISAVPGEAKSLIAEGRNVQITTNYSGKGLSAQKTYSVVCAYYNSSGRMEQASLEEVKFDNSFQANVMLNAPRAGSVCKLFLLEGAHFAPRCAPAQLFFTASVPDGTYSGSAHCITSSINYMADVDVRVKDGVITGITDRTLKEPMSTMDQSFYSRAFDGISDSIAKGSIRVDDVQAVDAVSGATISSNGLRSAIQDALDQQIQAAEPSGERYAPEGISLYARVYPVVTVAGGKISAIRIVPAKDTNEVLLNAFAAEIIEKQSVEGLVWPEEIRDDAFAVANLIDQMLYGKGVLK